jgi:hypothetical protein
MQEETYATNKQLNNHMFVVTVTEIKYPACASPDLPTELVLGLEEVINNEYLDAELASHVEEVVGILPESLKYTWTYDKDAE